MLVGLQLVERLFHRRGRVRRVFQFHHHKKHAVDEKRHIKPPGYFVFLHCGLIANRKVIVHRVGKVNQPHRCADPLALPLMFHLHAFHQHLVKVLIAFNWIVPRQINNLSQSLCSGFIGQLRIEPANGGFEAAAQEHIGKPVPLGFLLFSRERGVPLLPQEVYYPVFNFRFVNGSHEASSLFNLAAISKSSAAF